MFFFSFFIKINLNFYLLFFVPFVRILYTNIFGEIVLFISFFGFFCSLHINSVLVFHFCCLFHSKIINSLKNILKSLQVSLIVWLVEIDWNLQRCLIVNSPNVYQHSSFVPMALIAQNIHDVRWPSSTLDAFFVSSHRHGLSTIVIILGTRSAHMNKPTDYLSEGKKNKNHERTENYTFSYGVFETWVEGNGAKNIYVYFTYTKASKRKKITVEWTLFFLLTHRQCRRPVRCRWLVPSLLRVFGSICCFECLMFPANLNSQMMMPATQKCYPKNININVWDPF